MHLTLKEATHRMQPPVLTCADLSASYSRDPRDLAQANLIQVDAGCDVPRVLDSRDASEVIIRLDTTSRGRSRAVDSRGFWVRRLDEQINRFQKQGVALFMLDLSRVRVDRNEPEPVNMLADALVELMRLRAKQHRGEVFIFLEKTTDHGALSTTRGLVSFISLVNAKLESRHPELIDTNQLVLLPVFTTEDTHGINRALRHSVLDGSPYVCVRLGSIKPTRSTGFDEVVRGIIMSARDAGLQAILLYDGVNHRSITNRNFSRFMRWSGNISCDARAVPRALG